MRICDFVRPRLIQVQIVQASVLLGSKTTVKSMSFTPKIRHSHIVFIDSASGLDCTLRPYNKKKEHYAVSWKYGFHQILSWQKN